MPMKTNLLNLMCTLFATMVCVNANATVYTGNCGDSEDGQAPTSAVTYSFNDVNGVLTISGTGAMKTFSDQNPMAYPWSDRSEGSDAAIFNPTDEEGFWTGITSLKIEEGVTNIPDYAFAMQKNLTYVTLPSTLKSIGNSALEECAFTKLELPVALETIGDYAFLGAKFSKLMLPKTLKKIGTSAFNDCNQLTSIVIPGNVKEVGEYAFYGCTALTSVTVLAENAPTLGENAFFCNADETAIMIPSLTAIKVLEGSVAKYKGAENWNTYAAKIEAAVLTAVPYTATAKIPRFEELQYFVGAEYVFSHTYDDETFKGEVVYVGQVTEFGNYCLQWTSALRSIVVPDGVTKLGFQAFYACQNMTNISLPTTLQNIGDISGLAFEYCSALENGHFVIKDLKWWCSLDIKGIYSNPVYYAKHIYDAEGNEITNLVIPDDVTSVGGYTFARCEGLQSVTFHDNVTYIGSNAFAYCTGLTTVSLPKNMKKLEEYAFSRCSHLQTVTIPEGMEELGFCAFNYSGLTSLTLPSTITKMSQSFHNCEQLETLTLTDGLSNIGGSFYSCNALKEVRIPGSLKTMTYQDFNRCANLETVIIDEGVEEVAGFSECPRLVNLTIPSSAKKLGGLGFRDCSGLVTVNLPEGVEYVASFDGCSSLKQINFPSTITYVGTFKNCSALETVIVDDLKAWCEARHYDSNLYGPQKMAGKLCMKNAEGEIEEITKLVIPEGTTKLESGAFCHLTHLTSVTIPGTVKYLGGLSFRGCTGLTEIELPEGLERFGYMDFAGCTQLATLTIPSTVNYIDEGAFVELPAIENIWCRAFPNELYWRWYNDASFFKPEKVTQFHVVNAAAWQEKYPEANVTFVGDIEVGQTVLTYTAVKKDEMLDDYTKFKGAYDVISNEFEMLSYMGTVMLKGSVTGVADYAFRNNENLFSLVLPEGTATIGSNAFNNCSHLTSLTLPSTLTEIAQEAFMGAGQLADIYCDADAANVTWEDNANTYQFMADKATKFHVTDAAAWNTKFPDANVTFVDNKPIDSISEINGGKKTTDGAVYNLSGQRVAESYKGVVVKNGKRFLNR